MSEAEFVEATRPRDNARSRSNANNIHHALDFLLRVVRARLSQALCDDVEPTRGDLAELAYFDDQSAFGEFIRQRQPTFDEYVILLLALAPHVQPDLLDRILRDAIPESGDFPEIGGSHDSASRGFIPTGQTALYILAGSDLQRRFEVQRILTGEHWFATDNILSLEPAREGDPWLSGRLLLNREYIELFTLGELSSPAFSASFPAREISTEMEWDELMLGPAVMEQIAELERWIEHHDVLLGEWRMGRKIKPGYRALFHGPPGTGKTLTATLLGKHTGHKVFRIDLSTVVSKYIGETEKNLASLFDKAHKRQWILFFDEADALFGKRTSVRDAHDRYANQEVSYLLQRVEEFDGMVILASNFKANMDDAFLRRFNAIIKFPFPDEQERVSIWRKSLPPDACFEDGVDLPRLLGRFELTGGSIINVVQHACIETIARRSRTIVLDDAIKGIRREFEKEGKVFTNMVAPKT